jgi:hypothetical protein
MTLFAVLLSIISTKMSADAFIKGKFSSSTASDHASALERFGGFMPDNVYNFPVACSSAAKAEEFQVYVDTGGSFSVDGCFKIERFSVDWVKLKQCSYTVQDLCEFTFIKGEQKRDGWISIFKIGYLSGVRLKDRYGKKFFDFRCETIGANSLSRFSDYIPFSSDIAMTTVTGPMEIPFQNSFLSIDAETGGIVFRSPADLVTSTFNSSSLITVGEEFHHDDAYGSVVIEYADVNGRALDTGGFSDAKGFLQNVRFFSAGSFFDAQARFQGSYISARSDGWNTIELVFGENNEFFFQPQGKSLDTTSDVAAVSVNYRGRCEVFEIPLINDDR